MAYVTWMRPGFELGLAMQEIVKKNPAGQRHHDGPARLHLLGRRRQGMLPAHAGFHRARRAVHRGQISGQGRRREGLRRRRNIRRSRRRSASEVFAAILPWLRGQVSQQKRFIATIQDDDKILRFVNSDDAPRLAELGTSCPDHFLRTKIKPLYVDWDPQTGDTRRVEKQTAPPAWRSIARITRPITRSASTPTRPRCAIRTRPWF